MLSQSFFSWGEVYFDSITVLIALLLLARFGNGYILNRFRKKGNVLQSVFPDSAICRENELGEWRELYAKRILAGYNCKLTAKRKVPADGVVISGSVLLDTSILNGESVPEQVSKGSLVWAGTQVVEGEAVIEVTKSQADSRFFSSLSKISENIELGSSLIKKIDSRSLLFTTWVFGVAGLSAVFHFYNSGFIHAYETVLAIFVVSCPCALGISVPFAFTSAALKSSRLGIYFSTGGAIEELACAKKANFG